MDGEPKSTGFFDMKPLRTSEFSCFAMVNENGYGSVGDKSGAVAGVSGVGVHARHARVCGSAGILHV